MSRAKRSNISNGHANELVIAGDSPRPLFGERNHVEVQDVNALGSLEVVIMDYVWSKKEGAATVPELYKALRNYRGPDIDEVSYATIRTTTARLLSKGLLKEDRSDITFVYSAVQTREQVMEEHARKVVAAIVPQLGAERVMRALGDYLGGRIKGTKTSESALQGALFSS